MLEGSSMTDSSPARYRTRRDTLALRGWGLGVEPTSSSSKNSIVSKSRQRAGLDQKKLIIIIIIIIILYH
jgi:hypothetical protein